MNSRSQKYNLLVGNERLLHSAMATLAVLVVAGAYSLRSAIAQKADLIASDIQDCESLLDLEAELSDSITQEDTRKAKA
jgi:outer membrane murein-binding lipoprotein Lpp